MTKHSLLFKLLGLFVSCSALSQNLSIAVPGQLFVRWRDAERSQRVEAYQGLGVQVLWQSRLVHGLELIQVKKGTSFANARSAILRAGDVAYVEPNYSEKSRDPMFVRAPLQSPPLRLQQNVNDPYFSRQWALVGANGISLHDAWAQTTGSRSVRVAILDTGIDATHEELRDRVAPGYDFINNTIQVRDTHGHGTHVAGVIGAATNNQLGIAGISQQVTLIPVRVVPNDGDETDSNVARGFEFAALNGARVANCSFGKEESSQAVAEVIQAAGEKGVLAVVSAGNSNEDLREHPAYPASFHTPNMIVVSASTESGKRSSFSNWGPGVADIFAPGSSILSSILGNRYDSWDGTSMASPQISGVAALMLAVNPRLSAYKLKEILINSVTVVDGFEKYVTSRGRVNAGRAVTAAAAASSETRMAF